MPALRFLVPGRGCLQLGCWAWGGRPVPVAGEGVRLCVVCAPGESAAVPRLFKTCYAIVAARRAAMPAVLQWQCLGCRFCRVDSSPDASPVALIQRRRGPNC